MMQAGSQSNVPSFLRCLTSTALSWTDCLLLASSWPTLADVLNSHSICHQLPLSLNLDILLFTAISSAHYQLIAQTHAAYIHTHSDHFSLSSLQNNATMHAKMLTQITAVVVVGLCALATNAAPVRLLSPRPEYASH